MSSPRRPVLHLANADAVTRALEARGGVTVSVGSDDASHAIAAMSIPVPVTSEWLSPLLNSIPLQLVAYHIAEIHGCDIDKPRNLAKSVTVE